MSQRDNNSSPPNRVREALGRIYEHQPPFFREYLKRYEQDPTSRVFAPLAEAYRRMGRVDEAIEICKEGLRHHPDFHGGRVALAKCLVDTEAFEGALEELERVVQSVPENLLAQRLLGDVHRALKNSDKALHAYKMALLLSPNDVVLAEKVHDLEKFTPLESNEAAFDSPATESSRAKKQVIVPEQTAEQVKSTEMKPDAEGQLHEMNEDNTVLMERPTEVEHTDTSSDEDSDEDIDLLLNDDSEPDSFQVEHVSAVFGVDAEEKPEITTETLGDLYLQQGQLDRALQIFEKINQSHSSTELARKIALTKSKLGVSQDTLQRQRKIQVLRGVLHRLRQNQTG